MKDPDPSQETFILIDRAKAGDEESRNELFKKFAPYVYRLVSVWCGQPMDRFGDCDDMVQETLLKASQSLGSFGQDPARANFRGWLSAIARSVVYDDRRKWMSKKRGQGWGRIDRGGDSSSMYSSIFVGRDPTPSQVAIGSETEDRITEILLGFDDQYRQVIVLRKFCGMSFAEIAEKMSLSSENNARQICHRGLQKLKEAFEDQAETD